MQGSCWMTPSPLEPLWHLAPPSAQVSPSALSPLPCRHIPLHNCQVTAFCPLRLAAETDAAKGRDQAADRQPAEQAPDGIWAAASAGLTTPVSNQAERHLGVQV